MINIVCPYCDSILQIKDVFGGETFMWKKCKCGNTVTKKFLFSQYKSHRYGYNVIQEKKRVDAKRKAHDNWRIKAKNGEVPTL